MNRYPHLHELAAILRTVEQAPDTAPAVIRQRLYACLPPVHRAVLDWVAALGNPVKVSTVAYQFEYTMKHAGTILNELWQWGLLERKPVHSPRGRMYVYTAVTVGELDSSDAS